MSVWYPTHSSSVWDTQRAGTHTDEGAVIRKPGSTWLEGTPAMDLGHMNVALKWMYLSAYEWRQSDSSSSTSCLPKLFRAVIGLFQLGMDYRKWVGVVCLVLLPHVNMAWQLTPQIVSTRNRAVGFSHVNMAWQLTPQIVSIRNRAVGFSRPPRISPAARGGLRAEGGVDGQRPDAGHLRHPLHADAGHLGIRMVPTRREVYRTLRASVREAARGRCGHAEAMEHLQAS